MDEEKKPAQPIKLNDPFPGNSYKEKSEKAGELERKAHEQTDIREESKPITKAKKLPLAKRIYNTFCPYPPETMWRLWYKNVIKPTLINALVNFGHDTLDIWLTGETGNTPRTVGSRDPDRGKNERTPYNSISDQMRNSARKAIRSRYTLERIFVATRNDADDVLYAMQEKIKKYGQASVADLYDMVEIASDWPDQQYGWDDIQAFQREAGYKSTRDGIELIVPEPISLK